MQRLKRAVSRRLAESSRTAPARARATRTFTLQAMVEGLEDRVVMAAVSWVGAGDGGIWELPANWSNGKVPTAADDVTINLTSATGAIQITSANQGALSLTTNSNSKVQINNGGTFALGAGTSTIAGGVTGTAPNQTYTGGIQVVPGASLTVAPTAKLALNNAEITVEGTMTVGAGAAVTMTGAQTTPAGIEILGSFTTTGSTYTGGSYTGIDAYAGSRFVATNNVFSTAGVFIGNDATLAATDLTGNDFRGTVLSIRSVTVPKVTNNAAFGQVAISDNNLPSGTALNLTRMGTTSTASLFYRFVRGYTVQAGSSLVVDPNVRLVFTTPTSTGIAGTPFTIAAGGQAFLNPGDSVTVYTFPTNPQGPPEGPITINGYLSANGVTFSNVAGSAGNTVIRVNSGSTFLANNSIFQVNNVAFADNSVQAGYLTGNDFAFPLVTILATDVNLLDQNLEFTRVGLRNPSLAAGQSLNIKAIGTRSSANLVYSFLGDANIAAGATLTIDPNLRINLFDLQGPSRGRQMIIDGTVNFGAGDLIRMFSTPPDTSTTPPTPYPNSTSQIIVRDGGVMNAVGTSFITLTTSLATNITVQAGGRLTGSDNNFNPTFLTLAEGAILEQGDLTNNLFSFTTLTLPSDDLPLIANNRQFSLVRLTTPESGGVGANETLALDAIGTVTSSTLVYELLNDFTVGALGALTVAPGLPVFFDGTLNVLGTLTLNTGDSVQFGNIFVGDGTAAAVMNAPGTVLTGNAIVVAAGSSFTGVGLTGRVGSLTFGADSTDSLTLSNLTTQLIVDGAAAVTITGNNFFSTTVRATGDHDATPTIEMGGNYWGTTDLNAIRQTKVIDFYDDAALPEVLLEKAVIGVATIFATSATAVYGSAPQNIALSATVVGVVSTIDRGTVTFGIYDGATLIGTAQTVPLTNGAAAVNYTIPAFLPVGRYSIRATYLDDTDTFLDSIDTSHYLTITQAAAAVTAPSGSNVATYDATAPETATLTAAVTSAVGVVNEGTVTFTVFTTGDTPTQVGTPVTFNVVNGVATGTINLPAGTPVGTFTINVVFNGSRNYSAAEVVTGTLTVQPAATAVVVNSPTVTYSGAAQSIALNAQVGSPGAVGGRVTEGTVTFTLLGGVGQVIGTPVTVNVVNGVASGTYAVPPGLAAGGYGVVASYSGVGNAGSGNFANSASSPGLLIVQKADTATTAINGVVAYNPVAGAATLTASVTSAAGLVNEGSVTFQVFNGATPIGGPIAGLIVNGVATASYPLPAGLEVGTTYTVVVSFDGSIDFLASADSTNSTTASGTLTVVQATPILGVGADVGTYAPEGEFIGAHALVLVGSAPVTEGTVTFTVYNGATPIASSAAVAVGLDGRADAPIFLPAGTLAGGAYSIVAAYSGTSRYTAQSATNVAAIAKATPALAWAPPVGIVYGTPLTDAQLNAIASVPGSFAYGPAAGTILDAGARVLTATFTPADAVNYNGGTVTVPILVAQAAPAFGFLQATQVAQYTQPAIAVTGILAAGTTVPVGSQVSVSVLAGQATTTGFATVAADGTFTALVPLTGLPVGNYFLQYSFVGNSNFLPAGNAATVLSVARAAQAITTFTAPTSAVYGTTFHVDVASSSGLPVTLTATNATVVANPLGGYEVTMLSGTNAAILVASQAGDGNYADAPPIVLPVAAVKAQAGVALANLGIYTGPGPRTVSASTSPAGLNVAIAYTLNGVPVAVPSEVGTYAVSAAVIDPNYEGTASGVVVIVSAGNVTPPPPLPPVGPVFVTAANTTLNRQRAVTAINLTFNGALSAASVANLANYRLATPGRNGSFTARNARVVQIRSASYDASTNTVTLTLRNARRITGPTQLKVYGGPGTGLISASGQFIDGNRDGAAGGDETAIIRRNNRVTF